MKKQSSLPRILALTSARPEGATSLAIGLAALLSGGQKTLLIDLNPTRPEIAPLLNVNDDANVYDFAYRAQLGPVSPSELDALLGWQDGLAVLPGIVHPDQAKVVNSQTTAFLLAAAAALFDHVVVDLGRARSDLPGLTDGTCILWVLAPTRLGLASFDRNLERIRPPGAPWLDGRYAVINQVESRSLPQVPEFLYRQHGIPTAGVVPYEPEFWLDLGQYGALAALRSEVGRESEYTRMFGRPALHILRALNELIQRIAALTAEQEREEKSNGATPTRRIPRTAEAGRAADPGRLSA
jgi:Flp pilus assembly CpaE family ATPase